MSLGSRVRAAQAARGLEAMDIVAALEDRGEKVPISTLGKMLNETRPGSPRVWGKLWQLFGLPLAELYEGLEIPTSPGEVAGVDAELLAATNKLPESHKRFVLSYARGLPGRFLGAGIEIPEVRGNS